MIVQSKESPQTLRILWSFIELNLVRVQ